MTTSRDNSSAPKPTLRSTIWVYFSVFTAAIMLLIWVFQIATLDKYYEYSKRKKILRAAIRISSEFDPDSLGGLDGMIEGYAHRNGIAITVTDWNGNKISESDYMGGGSILSDEKGYLLFGYRNSLISSPDGQIFEVSQNEQFGTTELLFGVVLSQRGVNNPGYLLFINTSLEPIGSTADIIKEQFVIITIITFVIALFITMFLSTRLSGPFTNIIASANKLASGDYSARFDEGSYLEINELADTLNYAATEISKVSGLRNELIANVSHDLKTPLTMIKAYAEMIRDLSGDNPEKRAEHLEVIINETDRLSQLVNSLMELSKLQSGNSGMVWSQFSASEFLREVMSGYTLMSERTGFEFVLEQDEDAIVIGDEGKLKQVMYNFINNAVNYSGNSRKIIVRRINLPSVVRIEVRDFGVGIEKEKLPFIFDRYYRGDRTKRDVVGTGLGLSIVKEILELHKFRFGVSSELEKGSTFWFEIKRASESEDEIKKGNNQRDTLQRTDVTL